MLHKTRICTTNLVKTSISNAQQYHYNVTISVDINTTRIYRTKHWHSNNDIQHKIVSSASATNQSRTADIRQRHDSRSDIHFSEQIIFHKNGFISASCVIVEIEFTIE